MKYTVAFFVAVTAFGVAFFADAFTLQKNSQCVGGTLALSYQDVIDGGGLGPYTNAEMLASEDCSMLAQPGQCCSVHVSTNGGGFGGAVIPYTWFSYEIYDNATVQGGYGPTQDAPCLANQPGCSPDKNSNYGRQHKYFAGPVSGVVATVTASLIANPNAIVRGESSLLTWSSQNATTCTGTNFETDGRSSGTVVVSPSATTKYTLSCMREGSNTAEAHAIVTVSDGTLQASCRAHPTRARAGEDVLWSSTVSGPAGTYRYSWSGTDGLTGTANQAFKKYSSPGRKTASLTVTFTPQGSTPQANTSGGTGGGTPPPSTPPPGGVGELPGASVCPAIAWAVPVTPCSGSWTPTYDTGGCQSGWQCAVSSGGAQAAPSTGGILDTILNFFQNNGSIDTAVPETQDVNRDPGAFWFSPNVAHAACVETVNANQWYSGDAVPIASEGTLTPISCANEAANAGYAYWNRSVENRCPGTGAPCEYDPARTVCYGLNNPGSLIAKPEQNPQGGYPIRFDSGNVCGGSSCQNPTPTFNVQGSSCSGGTVVGRTSEMLDAAQIGMWPDGWMAEQCLELGATEGDCCEYSQKASNNVGGGFPPNSYYQIRVVRGGSFSQNESSYIQTAQCSGFNLDYSCSSVAGSVGTQCSGGPTGNGSKTITVPCENGVEVVRPQCSDEADNDGDGFIDYPNDPGCSSPEDDNEIDGPAQCADGIDNDGDGDVDVRDRGCNTGSGYNPDDDSEGGVGDTGGPQCADGVDNNGDRNIDWPDDPGCASADDNLEFIDPATVTFESDPPLIKKNQSCTLTLSARSVVSCTLTGPGVSRSFASSNGFISVREVVTPTLSQTSTYTLSCNGLDGKKVAKSVDCKIAPTFEEI